MTEKELEDSMKEKNPVRFVVGVGASAGGLEAIESLFKDMPTDTGMAFVVIQHLSPDYKSLMPELLAKRTQLSVIQAYDKVPIEPNSIYLIPPRKLLRIHKGSLDLTDIVQRNVLNLPIDIFFQSLAEEEKERSIGIVLSGTGSDGTRGSRHLKESGGLVIAQDEFTAKFDGMPKSVISAGLADLILPPEDIAKQLAVYVNRHSLAVINTEESDEQRYYYKILNLIRDQKKIDFTYYKSSTIMRRILRRISIQHCRDISDYVDLLVANKDELDTLCKELTIGVTNFFRDPKAFEELTRVAVPQLFRHLTEKGVNELRVWSAACSTGEEAYSLAILLTEYMRENHISMDLKIFATDIDERALSIASVGYYPGSVAADIPEQYLKKYFTNKDEGLLVSHTIREKVVFARHNVVKDPPFTNINLVVCRNLLIYLQPVLQRKVLEFFNFSLLENGVLFLGSSESIGDLTEYFHPVDQKWHIYRSAGIRRPTPLESRVEVERRVPGDLPTSSYSAQRTMTRSIREHERFLERFLEGFGEDIVDLALLINAQQELITSVGNTRLFLQLPGGSMSSDVARLVRKELSIPVSTGIKKCLKTNEVVSFHNIKLSDDDSGRKYTLRIKALAPRKGQERLLGLFIFRNVEYSKQEEGVDSFYDVSKEAEQRINDLTQELQFTRENLTATVEELETSNEELQATNEELLSSNEELQSTNEELQSVNEELYTVNAEYQIKITELTELTNDLDNLLENTEIGTLFLDEDFEIRRFSPRVSELFNIIKTDVGRSIFHLSHNMDALNLHSFLKKVVNTQEIEEQEINVNGHWYIVRGVPYKISEDMYAGVVMIFIETTRIKNAEKAVGQSENLLQNVIDNLPAPTFNLDDNLIFNACNHSLEKLLQREKEDIINKSFDLVWPGYIREQMYQDGGIDFTIEAGNTVTKLLKIKKYNNDHPTETVYLLSLSKLDSDAGNGYVGVMVDVTEREDFKTLLKKKNELAFSEKRFREAFDHSPIGMGITNKNGEFEQINDSLCDFVGYSREELLEMDFKSITHAEDLEKGVELFKLLQSKELKHFNMDKRYVRKDCSVVWGRLTVSAIFDDQGNVVQNIAQVQDITQLKEEASVKQYATEEETGS